MVEDIYTSERERWGETSQKQHDLAKTLHQKSEERDREDDINRFYKNPNTLTDEQWAKAVSIKGNSNDPDFLRFLRKAKTSSKKLKRKASKKRTCACTKRK